MRTTLSPLDLWTDPAGMMELMARWIDNLADGPKAGTSDSPLARVMGVGRQLKQENVLGMRGHPLTHSKHNMLLPYSSCHKLCSYVNRSSLLV